MVFLYLWCFETINYFVGNSRKSVSKVQVKSLKWTFFTFCHVFWFKCSFDFRSRFEDDFETTGWWKCIYIINLSLLDPILNYFDKFNSKSECHRLPKTQVQKTMVQLKRCPTKITPLIKSIAKLGHEAMRHLFLPISMSIQLSTIFKWTLFFMMPSCVLVTCQTRWSSRAPVHWLPMAMASIKILVTRYFEWISEQFSLTVNIFTQLSIDVCRQ